MNLLKIVTAFIDRTAMYRIVSGGLVALVLTAFILGAVGILPYAFLSQLFSLSIVVTVALGSNWLIGRIAHIPVNQESALITALITHFLFLPSVDLYAAGVLTLAVIVGIVSKYIIAIRKQHLINPAAAGAVVVGLLGFDEAVWWIGSPELFIPMVIVGVLVVAKIRKWAMVSSFVLVGWMVFLYEEWQFGSDVLEMAPVFLLSWPTLFFVTIMLTEPFTTPPTKHLQVLYGAMVGFLSNTTWFVGVLPITPELALVIGNLFFYPATLRRKLQLSLVSQTEIAQNTYEFIFKKPAGMQWQAGQYLEWMLPHNKADKRGIRRYFTIASAPTEAEVHLALRADEGGSSYKKSLLALRPGDRLIASQLAGDFVLPPDTSLKFGFIAGGIGVTPFRSFAGVTGESSVRDAVLFYANNSETDIAYRDIFDTHDGIVPVYCLAEEDKEGFEHGYLSTEILERQAPDYMERIWYISGPPVMVNACYQLLRTLKVPRKNIKRDFFPGLA